ncbi:unnamed protein product, partial [Iphiclides podalirius]
MYLLTNESRTTQRSAPAAARHAYVLEYRRRLIVRTKAQRSPAPAAVATTRHDCRYPYSRPGCGSNCDRRCHSDVKECNEQCVANGCDCIPPFVYNEVSGSCMPPDECTDAQLIRSFIKFV